MKKISTLAAFLAAVAMVSYGGNMVLAHAQTATDATTPSNTAALQQQLDDAKAELVQLQMEAGQVPAGDTGTPTTQAMPAPTIAPTLSATDVVEINGALTALANLLTTLQTKTQDPQFMSSNGPVVVSALQTIGQTIASIGTEVSGGNVAMAMPAAGSTGITQSAPVATAVPATQPTQVAPSAPVTPITPAAPTTPTTPPAPVAVNTAPISVLPQTAQASSAFSLSKLNWPLIIVIILIVAAIAIWLWWDDEDEKKQPVVVKVSAPVQQKPVQQPLQPTSQVSTANRQQTPLSSAVAPHSNS